MAMNMWLTASFKDYPVVFKDLRAQAFWDICVVILVAFLARMLEFVRNYLEEIVWKNNNYAEVEQGISQHSAIYNHHPSNPAVMIMQKKLFQMKVLINKIPHNMKKPQKLVEPVNHYLWHQLFLEILLDLHYVLFQICLLTP